ncbi:hypothetical protein N2152v2_000193 [Parachlorella kessleri]
MAAEGLLQMHAALLKNSPAIYAPLSAAGAAGPALLLSNGTGTLSPTSTPANGSRSGLDGASSLASTSGGQVGLESPAVAAALALWAAAAWWVVVAATTVLATLSHLPFNVGWWGMVFPLGVFTVAAGHLALPENLDSQGFRVAAAILSVVTVAVWAAVVLRTLACIASSSVGGSRAAGGTEPPSLAWFGSDTAA